MIGAVENRSIMYERTFSEVKRLSSAGLEGSELLRRVVERLRRSVPFEVYCASTVDPASNLITHGIAEGFDERATARRAVSSSTACISRRIWTSSPRCSARAAQYSCSPRARAVGLSAA